MAYKNLAKNRSYNITYHRTHKKERRERDLKNVNILKKQRKEYKKRNKDNIRKQTKLYYEKNKSKLNKKTNKWSKNNKNRVMVNSARRRAKKLGMDFNLVYQEMVWPERCPILDIPLDRRDRDHTPSIDRVDNTKGYTMNNSRVISMRANSMKRDASLEELKSIVKYMEDNLL